MKFGITIDTFDIKALIAVIARCGGYNQGFETEVTVYTDRLDDEGFVVHNEKLVEALRLQFAYGTTKRGKHSSKQIIWRATCEELSAGIAHIIAEQVGTRLIGMNIKVFNHLGYTSLEWNKGDDIPNFPRLATQKEIEETKRYNLENRISSSC